MVSTGIFGWVLRRSGRTIPLTARGSGGTGGISAQDCLGDLWCHTLSTAFKALKLAPSHERGSLFHRKSTGRSTPPGVIARLEFPARGDMPPLKLTWYDGGLASTAAERPGT